jgi:hypothetical protein
LTTRVGLAAPAVALLLATLIDFGALAVAAATAANGAFDERFD